jgi:glycosyltransferase involved in cell wall biosynthesis
VCVEEECAATGATLDDVDATGAAAVEVDHRFQTVVQSEADYDCRGVSQPEAAYTRVFEKRLVRGDRLADRHRAEREAHDSLTNVSWRGSRISVVLPTYNERDSIRAAIIDFAAIDVVDEILVINNNAAAGTSDEIAAAMEQLPNATLVREIHEPRQGYGFAIRRGLREAVGDYIVVSEPDGTFLGRDTFKLLAYVEDFDVVYGSRTARTFIWRGANMGLWLRWGNWGVAKLMEFLFNSTNLTDVGCTMRLIRREALSRMEPRFTVGGSAFGPEMMLLSLLFGLRVIQVPVNYLPRIGVSSVTGDVRKAVMLGFSMVGLVMRYRMRAWLGGA